MYIINQCPICKSELIKRPARYSKWLFKRIEQNPKEVVQSCYCENCNFVCFDHRLDDQDVEKLYSEYRGEKYNLTRIEMEPDYKDMAQYFANLDSDYWKNRISEYSKILDSLLLRNPKTILDFGGDGFVPNTLFPHTSIFVDDPSVDLVTNRSKFEMIFACEVFEHLSEPVQELRKLSKRLLPGGIIFLGVPKEYDDPIRIAWNRSQESNSSLTFMHEHINHFSMKSLQNLAQKANVSIHAKLKTPMNYQIHILMQKRKKSEPKLNNLVDSPERFYLKYLASK